MYDLFKTNTKKDSDFLHKAQKLLKLLQECGIMINWYLGTLLIPQHLEPRIVPHPDNKEEMKKYKSKIITFDFKFRTSSNKFLNYKNKFFMGHSMVKFIIRELARGKEIEIPLFNVGYKDIREYSYYFKLLFRIYSVRWTENSELDQQELKECLDTTNLLKQNVYKIEKGEERCHQQNLERFFANAQKKLKKSIQNLNDTYIKLKFNIFYKKSK